MLRMPNGVPRRFWVVFHWVDRSYRIRGHFRTFALALQFVREINAKRYMIRRYETGRG